MNTRKSLYLIFMLLLAVVIGFMNPNVVSGRDLPENPAALARETFTRDFLDATGQHFFIFIKYSQHWDFTKLTVTATPEPNFIEPGDPTASVDDITEGILTVHYFNIDGDTITKVYLISVDNWTRQLMYEGIPVQYLFEITGFLPFTPRADRVGVSLDFSTPIGVFIGPIEAGAARDLKYETDKGHTVVTVDDGRPHRRDRTEDEADDWLRLKGYFDKVTRTGPPTDSTNCIGWLFTCGKKWIDPPQVQQILDDNGYKKTESPQGGNGEKKNDIVVYRDADGKVTHVGLVTGVDDQGNVTQVESTFGEMGRYTHAPNDHPYGGTPTYYTTDRKGEGKGKAQHTLKEAKDAPKGEGACGCTGFEALFFLGIIVFLRKRKSKTIG